MRKTRWVVACLTAVLLLSAGGAVFAQVTEAEEEHKTMQDEQHPLGCTCDGCVMKAMKTADFKITELQEQPYVGIRYTMPEDIDPEEINSMMSDHFDRLMALVEGGKVAMAGAPFSIYFGEVDDGWDMLTGIPVKSEVNVGDGFVSGTLPRGKALMAMHYGPYEGLPTTYAAWDRYVGENGVELTGNVWESYLDDPNLAEDPSRIRTALYQIVK